MQFLPYYYSAETNKAENIEAEITQAEIKRAETNTVKSTGTYM